MDGTKPRDAGVNTEDAVEAREREFLAAIADTESDAPLTVREVERNGVPVLALEGEVDLYTAELFRERLARVMARTPTCVVIDLSRVVYLDSSGLALLLKASKLLPECMAVVSPRERITRLFRATGLTERIPLYPNLAEAITALRGTENAR